MSAIFGILRFDGGAVSARDLERMGNTLRHRGPDGVKSVVAGPAGLGHCLLRVNQEDLFERQPIIDRGADLVLAADLRIDNREELAGVFGIGAAELRDMPDSALCCGPIGNGARLAPNICSAILPSRSGTDAPASSCSAAITWASGTSIITKARFLCLCHRGQSALGARRRAAAIARRRDRAFFSHAAHPTAGRRYFLYRHRRRSRRHGAVRRARARRQDQEPLLLAARRRSGP